MVQTQPPTKNDPALSMWLTIVSVWAIVAIPTSIGAIITHDWTILGIIVAWMTLLFLAAWLVGRESKKYDDHEDQIMRMWRY